MNREEFVKRVLNGENTKMALCQEYGISRPTGDKWIARYLEGEGLEDKTRRPFHTPNRIAQATEARILAARDRFPMLGAAKLHHLLQREGMTDLPCAATINAVLQRNERISPEASEAATRWKRFARELPNQLWQGDFKGHFPLGNGEECHPLNILDDATRYALCCEPLPNERFTSFQPVMIRLFRENGMPEAFLTDNGNPWGNGASRGYSYCDVWMMQLGVLPMHGRLHHPQTQGKEERFNRSFTTEFLDRTTLADWADARTQMAVYRGFYNDDRPHQALEMATPGSLYKPSSREYPEKVREWEYGRTGREGRGMRVHAAGHLRFGGREYYLGEAFHGERVEMVTENETATLMYRQFRIARIDLSTHQFIQKRPQLVLEGDAPVD